MKIEEYERFSTALKSWSNDKMCYVCSSVELYECADSVTATFMLRAPEEVQFYDIIKAANESFGVATRFCGISSRGGDTRVARRFCISDITKKQLEDLASVYVDTEMKT